MRLIVFFLLLAATLQVSARTARTSETTHSTLIMKGLGHACLTLPVLPDGLPCNPAMTAARADKKFRIQGLISDGYQQVKNLERIVDGEVSQETVDNFFTEEKHAQLEASWDLMYLSPDYNIQFTPRALRGFSDVRNEANPDINVYVTDERSLRLQSAFQYDQDLHIGIQIRAVHRKSIKENFRLFQLATESGQNLLDPYEQGILFLEPGAAWLMEGAWKPKLSMMVRDWGYSSTRSHSVPIKPNFSAGFGLTPPSDEGEMNLGVEYGTGGEGLSSFEGLRLSALYRVNELYYSAGIDPEGSSVGAHYEGHHVNGGLVFATTRTLNSNRDLNHQTLYFQLGLQL